MSLEHYAGGMPLHVAVWFDDFAAVGLLLDAGADPLAPTDFDDDTLSPVASPLWATSSTGGMVGLRRSRQGHFLRPREDGSSTSWSFFLSGSCILPRSFSRFCTGLLILSSCYLRRKGLECGTTGHVYVDEQLLVARHIDAGADPNGAFQNQRSLDRASASIDLAGTMEVLLEKGDRSQCHE